MSLLNFPRPRSCEVAEASILAAHEAEQARVIREHEQREQRQRPSRELVRFASESSTLGLIVGIASDLERAGVDVSLQWLRDERNDVIGIAILAAP